VPLSHISPHHYDELLQDKVERTCELLAPFTPPPPEVFASQPTGFRMRAEFRMWHEGDDLNYVMYKRNEPKTPIAITSFEIADAAIQRLMPVLLQRLKNDETLRGRLFQCEFLATLSGEILVTLIYHRRLTSAWEDSAQQLRQALLEAHGLISIVGRSRKQKIVIGEDFVQETLQIQNRQYHYRQHEQAFTQPNARVNIQMIEWACRVAKNAPGNLLELYCGNGNFTLPLSNHFDQVIATELSKVSVRAAKANLEKNAIENVQMIRLSAQEVTEALANVRAFRRLAELPLPLDKMNLQTLFVDPPRAGLDSATLAMAHAFPAVIYVSCNPETLASNLSQLCKTHTVRHFALFDQFPYTHHMECGVLLEKH